MAVNSNEIIEATIRCAYRTGLPAVTMNQIGQEVGILGQGLYNHFGSKAEILAACFQHCNQQLSDLYEGYQLDSEDDLQTSLKKLWFQYFNYFVTHPAENCFYRQFRELKDVPDTADPKSAQFRKLWELIDQLDQQFHFNCAVPQNMLVYYLRNITPYLARGLSEGILEDTEETREQMWQLVSNGLSVLWRS